MRLWWAAALAAVGCSVQPRSEVFRCAVDSQCGSGRICDGEWCVLGNRDSGVEVPDAFVPDAFVCPTECTECVGGTCVIDCPNDGDCDGDDIVCPPGLACEVNCDGVASCVNLDIDCGAATECAVNCDGAGSCDGAITCSETGDCNIDCGADDSCAGLITSGSGDTDVDCETDTACGGGVECTGACACDVTCAGMACPVPATCPPGNNGCTTPEGGCETIGQCDTC